MNTPIRATFLATAHYALWLPALLTVHFLARAFGLGTVAFCLAAAAALVHIHRTRPTPTADAGHAGTEFPAQRWAALAVLLIVLAPVVPVATKFALGILPSGFTNADESYNFMIARALEQGFPPADLGYKGRPALYHLGGPLLSEMLSRLGVPLHAAFFLVWPVVLRIVAVAVTFSLLVSMVPGMRTSHALWGVLATDAVLLVNPYNLLWNVRNAFKAGGIETQTLLYGMPAVTPYGGLLNSDFIYGSPLAALLAWLLVANARSAHWLWLACTLFAAFLAKSSVFVPVGMAWGAWAVLQAARHREWRFAGAGALALGLCLFARPFVFEPGVAALAVGEGYGFDWLVREGSHLAQAAYISAPAAVAFAGLLLLAASSHVWGWAVTRPGFLKQSPTPVLLLALVAFAALFTTFGIFRIDPIAQSRFLQVHESIASLLWRPVDTYIYELWKMSVGEARILVSTGLALLAVAAASSLAWDPARMGSALAARIALGLSAVIAVVHLGWLAIAPDMSRWKAIPASTTQALASIPVSLSVILTNDCAYDPRVERHLPLMNAALSSLFGHQFWACNFMFGNNFAAADATWRLDRQQWFWGTAPDAAHLDFLRRAGITHLLLAHRLDPGATLQQQFASQAWLRPKSSNEEYSVFEVTP